MAETGHHRAAELCALIRARHWPVRRLLFLHHGLEILRDPAGEKAKADAAWGAGVLFASDGMTVPLQIKIANDVGSTFPAWGIVLIVAAGVLALAGLAVVIAVLAKRREKKNTLRK